MDLTHGVSKKLKDLFVERIRKNPQYSLRAYAKYLGITPGGLSQILAGKKRLSAERAEDVADRLGLEGRERQLFLLRVEFDQAKSEKRRAWVLDQMQILAPAEIANSVSVDEFRSFSRWYGLPLHELLRLKPGLSPREIADFFSISEPEAEDTCERMVRLNLLVPTESGGFRTKVPYIHIETKDKTEITKNYYMDLLPKIEHAIQHVSNSDRAVGAEVFSISEDQITELTRLTNQYLDDLQKLTAKAGEKVRIFQAVTIAFPLAPTPLSTPHRKENEK